MTKSGYFSNSAKMLAAISVLLLVTNLIVLAGNLTAVQAISELGTNLSSISTYVVLVVAYVALNGEGIGHKRNRNRKAKKKTGYLKLLVLFCFFFNRFFKGMVVNAALHTPDNEPYGVLARLGVSLLSTVSSYGFLIFVISLWCLFRDYDVKKLHSVEAIACVAGVVYGFYKLLNYAFAKYGVNAPVEAMGEFFSSDVLSGVLCALQYALNVLAFFRISQYYQSIANDESIADKNYNSRLFRARVVYEDKGYGIDTLEDTFLT